MASKHWNNKFPVGTITQNFGPVDDIANLQYPMPLHANDKDDVFVGRLRRDETQNNTLNCWIVSDNLRKGAATNAVQIAEKLLQEKFV